MSEQSQDQLMENLVTLKKGDFVKGTIVKIEDDLVYVSVGYKYDGIIPVKELSSIQVEQASDIVKIGEEVELKVLEINDQKEKMTLSKRLVDNEKGWEDIEKHLADQDVFEVVVADVVKGGLVADVGVRAFIPSSMVERQFVEDFTGYKGRTLRVVVKEIDREANKVILSQRDVLDKEYEANKKEQLAALKVGDEVTGTISRITNFGAFVDINGIDGLIHLSELAWKHIKDANEVVTVGQQVTVKILKVEAEQGKVALSLKATQAGPWEKAATEIAVDDVLTGKVKRITTFGAFVEVSEGIEGLVHISQLAYKRVTTPHEIVKLGQEVQVKVIEFTPADKRLSLSIKATQEAPASEAVEEKINLDEIDNPNVSFKKEEMNVSLAELFGDKLSQFK